MKKCLFILFFVLFAQVNRAQQVSFCVQAHQDDWQLFNSKNVINDIHQGNKLIFITLTAGNAGNGAGGGGTIPYFLARERGSVYSAKFAQDIFTTPITLAVPQTVPITYTDKTGKETSHLVVRYSYKNTESYFLRLPDGGIKGDGFPASNGQSLLKLMEGKITSIGAVDNSASYQGWDDLVRTIEQIILNEKGDNEQAWMYLNSVDDKYSMKDHKDHYCTSSAAIAAVKNHAWVGIMEWMSYSKSKKKSNLNENEHENATALFAVYNWSLLENGYVSAFESHHKSWLPRDYYRVYRNPVGKASESGSHIKAGNVALISYACLQKNADLHLRVNAIEEGRLEVKIYDLAGKMIYSNFFDMEDKGVKDFEIKDARASKDIIIVSVALNQSYFDTKKVM